MTPRRLLVILPSVLLCLCGCLFAQEPDYPTPAFWYLAEEFHAVSMELVDISQSFPENSGDDLSVREILVQMAQDESKNASWAARILVISGFACENSRDEASEFAEAILSELAGVIDFHLQRIDPLREKAVDLKLREHGRALGEKLLELKTLLEKPLPE